MNGIDMGTSMACYTPVEFPITSALKFGTENEILIKVGDRVWLPSEAAGGYVLVAEFTPENGTPVISRRFLKVGQAANYSYFNINPITVVR